MYRDLFIISPPIGVPDDPIFSPGRAIKLSLVMKILNSLKLSYYSFFTYPSLSPSRSDSFKSLTYHYFPLFRIPELVFNCIRISILLRRKPTLIDYWTYNTRFSEALCYFLLSNFCIKRRKLYVQLEDMPQARKENAGIIGMLDFLSTKYLFSQADCIFTVSPAMSSKLKDMIGKAHTNVILLPPILSQYFCSVTSSRVKPFTSPTIQIVYAGGSGPEKGVSELLAIFTSLKRPNFRLSLYGRHSRDEEIYRHHPHIRFMGYVDHNTLCDVYASADVIVNPHKPILSDDAVFPFKLIEILASGALPITSSQFLAESIRLPADCIFTKFDELGPLLEHCEETWKIHSKNLSELSANVREKYSIQAISSIVAACLSSEHI